MSDLSDESSGAQVWLVTGASRGLGMALTRQLLAGERRSPRPRGGPGRWLGSSTSTRNVSW